MKKVIRPKTEGYGEIEGKGERKREKASTLDTLYSDPFIFFFKKQLFLFVCFMLSLSS